MEATNRKIAALLQEQTFAEREALAASFRDMAVNAAENTPPDELNLDWFMHSFEYWAEGELADEEPTP